MQYMEMNWDGWDEVIEDAITFVQLTFPARPFDISAADYPGGFILTGPVSGEDDWAVLLHLQWREDHFHVVEVSIRPAGQAPDPWSWAPGTLSPTFIRGVQWGSLFESARQLCWMVLAFSDERGTSAFEQVWRPRQDPGTRPGPPDKSRRTLALLAARYVALIEAGERAPTKALAEELNYSPVTINEQLRKARNAGLLTAAPKGKAGGRLTAKAKKLLEDDHG